MMATKICDGVWQIGDYIIEERWEVRKSGSEETISAHPTLSTAELTAKRYQASDKKRAPTAES